MKRALTIILIFVALFYLTSCGKKEAEQASTKILEAKVTLVMGEAYLLRENSPEKMPVKIGTRLKPADVIITTKNAAVNVVIAERGVLKIKENSKISFKELLVVDTENNVAGLKVTAGKVVLGLKKLAKKSEFEVETPTAVAGVRGTLFMVSVQKEETSAFPYFVKVSKQKDVVTKVGVLSGKVKLINPQKPAQSVMVDALKEVNLINDNFKNIKNEKISSLTLNEIIKDIKELPEIRELNLKEITDEIKSVEPQIEELMKKEIKTKAEIKSTSEDLSVTESELEKEKMQTQQQGIQKIDKTNKRIHKYQHKYLHDDETSW